MDTKNIDTDPQAFQIQTVKAITELKSDIRNLTEVVKDLKVELQRRDETFVTISAHARDIQDCYTQIADTRKLLNDVVEGSEKTHNELRHTGKIRSILWSLLSLIIAFLATYVFEDLTHR